MAFEISTKKETKKINWLDLIFYFSLILLLIIVLSYFVLEYSIEQSKKELKSLEDKITEQSEKNRELETSLKEKKKLIDDFSKIIDQHKLSYQAFGVIEKLTHPEVFLTDFDFDSKTLKISLSGITSSFRILGEQLLIFKSEKMITNFNLSNISLAKEITKEKNVEFNLDISLSPQVFIFSSQSQ